MPRETMGGRRTYSTSDESLRSGSQAARLAAAFLKAFESCGTPFERMPGSPFANGFDLVGQPGVFGGQITLDSICYTRCDHSDHFRRVVHTINIQRLPNIALYVGAPYEFLWTPLVDRASHDRITVSRKSGTRLNPFTKQMIRQVIFIDKRWLPHKQWPYSKNG